ncbi:F0F1 ATP synthase subunit A [bacterium]|nr:F0F1 ATP synthase subunit A [bacterium]
MHVHFGLTWFYQLLYCFITTAIILIFAYLVHRGRKKDGVPGSIQNIAEVLVEALDNIIRPELGKEKLPHILPFLGTFVLFILISNFFLIVPHAHPPTSDWSNTFALALIVVISLQYYNIKLNGPKKAAKLWLDPIPGLGKKEDSEELESAKIKGAGEEPNIKKKSRIWKIAVFPFLILYIVDNFAALISLPIRTMVIYCLIASGLILAFSLWIRSKLKGDNIPTGIQCLMEWMIVSLLKIFGLEEEKDVSLFKYALFYFIGTLALILAAVFILFIPFNHTAIVNILSVYSILVVIFFIFNYLNHSLTWHKKVLKAVWVPASKLLNLLMGFLKQIPVKIIVIFLVALHVVDNGARMLSLSLRLFGNIFGEHSVLAMVTDVAIKRYYFVVPIFIPFMIFCMDVLFAVIQTLVFVMLSLFYFKEELGVH